MKRLVLYGFVMLTISLSTSCTTTRNSSHEGNYALQFNRKDFEFSDVVTGTAKEVKVLGIDWKRLFNRKETVLKADGQTVNNSTVGPLYYGRAQGYYYGSGSSGAYSYLNYGLPLDLALNVIGSIAKSHAEELALHDLAQKNPDFDVILFPKYDKKTHWWILGRTTTVTAKARLGQLKKESPVPE
jgi:hypothetical protein